MDNSIINELDKISLIEDIDDRNKIIEHYKQFGILDRNDAINKIRELRVTNSDVAKATTIALFNGGTPFDYCSNDQIVSELIMQRDILQNELIKKQLEETDLNEI